MRFLTKISQRLCRPPPTLIPTINHQQNKGTVGMGVVFLRVQHIGQTSACQKFSRIAPVKSRVRVDSLRDPWQRSIPILVEPLSVFCFDIMKPMSRYIVMLLIFIFSPCVARSCFPTRCSCGPSCGHMINNVVDSLWYVHNDNFFAFVV